MKKAGLENETTAVLFGLLLEAQEQLQHKNADSVRQQWRIKGDIALTKNTDELTRQYDAVG